MKESLLIKHDKPVLNRTTKSFPLDLFDQVLMFTFYKKFDQFFIFLKKKKCFMTCIIELIDKLFCSKCNFWEWPYCKRAKAQLFKEKWFCEKKNCEKLAHQVPVELFQQYDRIHIISCWYIFHKCLILSLFCFVQIQFLSFNVFIVYISCSCSADRWLLLK